MDYLAAVREFMKGSRQEIRDGPGWPDDDIVRLRMSLHKEEFTELALAMLNRDMVETADGIADLIYVLCGTALALGIDLDRVFAEVQRSNMTKVADAQFREDGKLMKGPNFSPPDIAAALA